MPGVMTKLSFCKGLFETSDKFQKINSIVSDVPEVYNICLITLIIKPP